VGNYFLQNKQKLGVKSNILLDLKLKNSINHGFFGYKQCISILSHAIWREVWRGGRIFLNLINSDAHSVL
jgi:hypothetical protein